MDTPKKKILVEFSTDPTDAKTYDVFLIKTEEDHLEIQLCARTDTDESITFDVQEVFKISADSMFPFCVDIVRALDSYEKKYQNHKGWPTPTE